MIIRPTLIKALLLAGLTFFYACQNKSTPDLEVSSPDKALKMILYINDNGAISYQIWYQLQNTWQPVMDSSDLGIIFENKNFSQGLSLIAAGDPAPINEQYDMISGKRLSNEYEAVERTFDFKNQEGDTLILMVRMFDKGFAFRYKVPADEEEPYQVNSELTSFHFPTNCFAWIEPYDTLQKWGPSHEVGYENKVAIGQSSPKSTGWAFPALFQSGKHWVLISESDLDDSYVGLHLNSNCRGGNYRVQFPWPFENYGMGNVEPSGKGTFISPWRFGIVSTKLNDIIESNLVHHLARPNKLKNTGWITPGKSSWSWWGQGNSPRFIKPLKDHVDLAAELGWKYSLVDADWHIMEDGSIEELAEYAEEKGVGLLLWYNSAGEHTKVLEVGPIDRMHTSELRRKEFERIKKFGIKGVKVDFFQSDKQHIMHYYETLARDAADFELLVNTHSSTVPRGWARTYPNFLAMEAVKGAEQYPMQNFVINAPVWNNILPYTRNVIGPMDYTPVTFSDRDTTLTNAEGIIEGKKRRLTTNAHELALSVVFECGIQHFADRAPSYRAQPDFVLEFLKEVPVVWDDTWLIDGYPGEFTIIGRKLNNTTYIAGINGLEQAKTVNIKLQNAGISSFTNSYLIKDGDTDRSFEFRKINEANLPLQLTMPAYGGFVWVIEE